MEPVKDHVEQVGQLVQRIKVNLLRSDTLEISVGGGTEEVRAVKKGDYNKDTDRELLS